MSLDPPKVKVLEKFNRDDFEKKISVPVITFDAQNVNINNVLKPLRKLLLKIQKFQPVDNGKIFLNPDLVQNFSQLPAEQLKSEGIAEDSLKFEDFTLKYENWNANELIKAILPDDIEPLTSYSRIGHIIHFNFRDDHQPYKSAIAQIYFDKSAGCRTIINKAENIDNTFRNFQIELLMGEPDYQVEVKENGIAFEFDFSQVFWNPRLSAEHERLVKMLKPNDFLYDVFAGVGPFAIPSGKKRVNVLANDLNPHSYKWLEHNVKKNKVQNYVKTFNKDGRDFILENIKSDLVDRIKMRENDPVEYSIHIAMNLPALSTTFLDAFVGVLKGYESKSIPVPQCHCYCFVKGRLI
jgi:tRNA (guanine37-N1)-methyltransferase